jgi:hypothetical protein
MCHSCVKSVSFFQQKISTPTSLLLWKGRLGKNYTLFVATDTYMIRYPYKYSYYISHVKEDSSCTAPAEVNVGILSLGCALAICTWQKCPGSGSECFSEDKQIYYLRLNMRVHSKFRGLLV